MKTSLPIVLLLVVAFKAMSQCTDPVFSFSENFTNTLNDPPECWTEVAPSQTAYNTGAMRILGAHNGDPQAMVITRKLFNVRGVLSFKAKKGESFFNLPGDGLGVGVIDAGGNYINLFDVTYTDVLTTYTFDFSTYTGTGDKIAIARTGVNKKIVSIDDITYTSICEPGVTAVAQDITISLDESGTAILTPQQVDNGSMDDCNNAAAISIDVTTFDCNDLGTNTVTLTAEDTFGNTQTTTATVTVEPFIEMVVTEDPVTIELDATGNASITTNDLIDQSATTCGNITLSLDQSSFTCSDLGDLTVMVTATHSTGPDASVTKMISIVDNIPPTASINSSVNLALDATTFVADLTVPMVDAGSSDNCSIATNELSKTSFSCADIGENLVTYTITDASGNEVESTITVNVTSSIVDESITTSASNVFCPSGTNPGGTISSGSSVVGVDYFLRNSADNSIVDGPIAGTGSALDFTTGSVDGSQTYNVYAVKKDNGAALSFDGVNDYVDLGTAHRNILKEITVAVWVRTSPTGAANFISGKYDGIRGYLLYIDANGKAAIDGRDGGGYKTSGVSTTSVNDGQWHLLAGTIDLNTGEWKIYVDGTLENSVTYGVGSSLATSTVMLFGAHSTLYFTGDIDQFAVYNEALDATAVGDLTSSCLTGSESGLVGLYNLDEGSGATASDLSTSNISGTLTNMDASSDWIVGNLACEILCERQMSTEITFGDDTDPQLMTQNIMLQLDAIGEGSISTNDVDNGSTDNCTSAGNLIMSLSQTTFGCGDVGENTVTFTVTDEAGNSSSSEVTVTVQSPIDDQVPSIESNGLCSGESTNISIPASESGIEYYLRKSADNSVIDGPIAGTGSSLDFNTGAITETTDYHVLAKFGGGPGTSLYFDGSNDHINTDVEIPVTSAMTIEAWIYPVGGLTNTIMTNSIHAGNGNTNLEPGEFWFNTASNSNGNGLTFTYIATNGVAATHARTNILTSNAWNHVAVAFDGATGIANMWINGVALTTSNTVGTSTQMGRSGSTINIGKRHGGSGSKFFNGRIDEVRVWNSIRTTQEILDNKDVCLTGNETDLIAYFDFNEGDNNSIGDQVAGGVGTLVNFNTASAWVDGSVGCVDVCEVQMSTEVTVEVNDAAPTIAIQDITVQLDATGNAVVAAADLDNGSSDDCSATQDLTFSLDKSSFTCDDLGSNNVIVTIEDLAGNESTANATITVVDDLPPVIAANNVTVQLDVDGNASITTALIDNGTTDNCTSEVSLSLSKTAFTCSDLGENTITFTATDGEGNESSQSVTVSVEDDIDPTAISLLTVEVSLDEFGVAQVDPASVDAGSSDNCTSSANLTMTLSQDEFACSETGSHEVTFTVTDESGSTATSQVTITVVDDSAPNAVAVDYTIRLDENNEAGVFASDIDNGSSDNCGTITKSLARDSGSNVPGSLNRAFSGPEFDIIFTEEDLGVNAVVLTITDEAGNESTATATVTVEPFKLDQTISLATIESKIYGAGTFDLSGTSTSGLTVSYSLVSGPATLNGNTVTIIGAGDIVIEANQAGDDTYAPAESVQISISVAKADLTVTADDLAIFYEDPIPTLTLTYAGFVNGDDATSLDETPTASTSAGGEEGIPPAGIYDILLSGGVSSNYSIHKVNGTLTINKKVQVITIQSIDDREPKADPFDIVASVNSSLTLDYSISGPATLSGTTITLDGTEGVVTVTVSQNGDNNHEAASATVSFDVMTPLSVGENLHETIKVYPNPVVDRLNIESDEPVLVRLFGTDGKLIKSISQASGSINVHELKRGIYILEISTEDEKIRKRIIKAN